MTIGKRISELRKQHNYSQEYLAERLNVSRQAVSKWEQDQTSPDTNNLIALAQLFDVSVEYLATGRLPTPDPQPDSSPAPKFGVRTIIGLILIGGGVQSLILGLIFSELLLLLALYFLAGGLLCLIWRADRVITLSWIILFMLVLTIFILKGGF